MLLLAGKDHPRARGVFFLLGSITVLVVVGAVVLLLGSKTVQPGAKHHDTVSAVVDLTLGAGLLALAAIQWRRKTPPKQRSAHPEAAGVRAAHYYGFGGVMMLVNFSTVVLYIAAMKDVAHASVSEISRLTVGLGLVLFAALPVIVPLAAYTVAPGPAGHALARLNDFVGRYKRPIAIAVLVLFGAYLIFRGATELS